MIRAAATLLVALLCASAALARDIAFTGALMQGGLVVARAEGARAAQLDNRTLAVAPDGTFVFGLAPDAKAEALLVVRYADGTEEARTLQVARQTWKVERIDGLPPAMVNPPPAVQARISREATLIANARRKSATEPWFAAGFGWPVVGRISGVFGSRRVLNGQEMAPHWGVDIAMPTGTPVLAPAPGVVTLAEPDLYYTGGTIILDHGFGVMSTYSHLSKVSVQVGQVLKAGDTLGAVGATGRVTGPHLHWNIHWFDVRIDPALVAPPMLRAGG
ncbi:MAG: M23 family metallopeptidase [Alphaproteobacteria bacterium]|nr:M23 family metallopeptidase [Alphaproteobacteria bacterium]